MGIREKAIDLYITNAADFARPILLHLRELVHHACPDVVEKMKWSFPHFDYKEEMMCSMAAFKYHCAFCFWKANFMKDERLRENVKKSMGHLGKIASLSDLPSDNKMLAYIREAMALTDAGIKLTVHTKPDSNKELEVPGYFSAALLKHRSARLHFEEGSYSFRKEYVAWITEAKTAVTRERRMNQAIEWLAEGKGRHWKYQK